MVLTKLRQLADIRRRLASLVIFRGLNEDPAVLLLRQLLDKRSFPAAARTEKAAELSRLLLDAGQSLSEYLLQLALWDENPYVVEKAAAKPVSTHLEAVCAEELAVLETLGRLTLGDLGLSLPLGWQTEMLDYRAAYQKQLASVGQTGYGIFARHPMFLLGETDVVPVVHPDPVMPGDLAGYEDERRAVMENTQALLAGRPAANVLLYGDSGTGKSTCVKAAVNGLHHEGLRLIELRKDQLDRIPLLMDRLTGNPLKFILFIDDLSFPVESEQFSALKAVLEGSVSARSTNTAIYATSNRRHLVKERFSQRDGDEIHVRDTLEEQGSLSERFGLTVTFLRPDRKLYQKIVESYCLRYGIAHDEALAVKAEAYALGRGGRSARTARQFIESAVCRLAAGEKEFI